MKQNTPYSIIPILSPLTGRVVPLDEVPDQVFAQRMLGEGLAVDPVEGLVLAPADGRVETIFPTGHAMVLGLNIGSNLLLHIGIGTARLGKAFEKIVEPGEEVKRGQLLLKFNLEIIRQEAESVLSPIIILNPFSGTITCRKAGDLVRAGEDVLLVVGPQGDMEGGKYDGCPDVRS